MGISVNGPSGIDTQSLIDSLVELERTKVTTVEKQKKAYQLKIDGYAKFKTLLTDMSTKAGSLSKLTSFDIFKTTSSNEKIVSVTAGTGSVNANYDLKVFQLAANEKMITGDNLVTDQTASLDSLGIGTGTISIDGTEIEIDGDDTLQDMRQKINSATDSSGARLNVSASVLKIADDNYRLVLTAKKSGSEGVAYKDVSGSVMQNLGIITTADGNKGTTNQMLTVSAMKAAWDGLTDDGSNSVTITGKDRNGQAVDVSIVKHAGDTADDLLKEVEKAFNGMVSAAYNSVTNDLEITDRVGGTSQLAISGIAFENADGPVTPATPVTVSATYGEDGAGVLSTGKDSFFSIENVFMSNASNTATGFVNGVTFNFHGVSKDEDVTVTLERDVDGIRGKFQEMLDAYNALLRYSKSSTKVADPDDETSTSGALSGDMTVRSVVSQINGFFHQQFGELNSVYTSFNMLGLKTDTKNGELSIDADKFNKATSERFDEVANLFITAGTSNNNNIILGTSTSETTSGKYVFEEADSLHFRARLESGSTWYESETRTGDIIHFDEGPLKGLSVTAPADSIGAGNTATFTMSKGLSTIINESIAKLTDGHDGLVALRTESYNQSISRTEDKIIQLEDRIEKYRLRLVSQFSAMEQAMSKMQSQTSNMISQLTVKSK